MMRRFMNGDPTNIGADQLYLTDVDANTNLWQMARRAEVEDALCLVELRGFEPTLACHRGILTTKPRVAGHCTRAGGLAFGDSFGFVEQSCCANARAPVSETRSCWDDVR
jgi:hypothetical protein